ncbi:MAG: DUF2845 domain-containing protein [Pseudomonadota bacterium]|nr:DUF2845 domain-containing protein [Gammaproteobacteria bacterium]MBU1558481.1 DUF2845 domain-containing protein [Gammaproteobacteria bacterium]MBU1628645.1 DUF2845 domain-containing protein [Gammaproteobacteria bacterium]MBU1926312.1 DUF2845 domain-containing protein [Gammaproteobacteria bacterium]MBU2546375.1 DUF2845 domain-containing protein [Gammaproteobacteria bacterium]
MLSCRSFFQLFIFFIVFLCSFPPLFAADYFYCSKSLDYAHLGDSITHVRQICGEPVSESTKTVQPYLSRDIERWVYDFQPNSALLTGTFKAKKSALVVEFYHGKVIHIEVEGQSVESTDYCRPDLPIQIGNTTLEVYNACRYASVRETVQQKVPLASEKQTILTYSTDSYSPPTHFYFQKNKLVQID